MNSASHLLPEDRPAFERAVDEALRETGRRPGLAAAGERISTGQLRVMALSAATTIAADAADEYERYVALRTRARRPVSGPASSARSAPAPRGESDADRTDEGEQPGGTGGLSLAGVGEGVSETTGAGLLAMVSVLVPLLAGTAAVIFLLLGNVLRVVSPEPSIAAPMRGAGWVFAVLAAAGIIVAMAELWLTAVRNGSGARGSGRDGAVADGGQDESRMAGEVAAARTLWREALLERGIVPFLERALAEGAEGGVHGEGGTGSGSGGSGSASAPEAPSPSTRTGGEERTPRLGYSGPDFSSRTPSDGQEHGAERGKERESLRPRYSRPDWSSPDYGGPEHKPE